MVSSHRQFSLMHLGVWILVIALVVAVGVKTEDNMTQLLVLCSPFFIVAYALWYCIPGRRSLSKAFAVLHCVTAVGLLSVAAMLSDGVAQWASLLPLGIIDFPVAVLFTVYEPH